MNRPFFSIIVVTFNAGEHLRRALDSILLQSFTDWELLIVDGLSADNTLQIADEYQRRYSSIHTFSEKDNGIYDAMNKGVKLARGEWLYFLGADDWLKDKTVLQKVAEEIRRETADIIYGNVLMLSRKLPYDGAFSMKKLLRRNISHQAIFYNKSVFAKIGNYDTRFRKHADWDFNLRCFQDKTISVRYIKVITAVFTHGGTSFGHDKAFLTEGLLPLKLNFIIENPTLLRNIVEFDDCWRLFRNAGAINIDDLKKSRNVLEIPSIIRFMLRFQSKIPASVLKIGFFSKLFMSLSYVRSLFIPAR